MFAPPYASSVKEPDQCILPPNLNLPTVAVESRWSESRPHLLQDAKLWLQGGAGQVQVVIVLKWTRLVGGRVKGQIEQYRLDQAASPTLIQREVVIYLTLQNLNI